MDGTILFVCTGNVRRSAFAERLLRSQLAGREILVISAGTHAVPGEEMDPLMAWALKTQGADPAGFRSQLLTVELVARADLIATAEMRHRAAVARLYPPVLGRVFTLAELSDLVSQPFQLHGVTTAQELAREAAARRGWVPARSPETADIPDPKSRRRTVHRHLANAIAELVTPVAISLRR